LYNSEPAILSVMVLSGPNRAILAVTVIAAEKTFRCCTFMKLDDDYMHMFAFGGLRISPRGEFSRYAYSTCVLVLAAFFRVLYASRDS
jgi:hypothetical protein